MLVPRCFGDFNDYYNYCWYYCPFSYECEDETYWYDYGYYGY